MTQNIIVPFETVSALATDIGSFLGNISGMCNQTNKEYMEFFHSKVKPGLLTQDLHQIRMAMLELCKFATKKLCEAENLTGVQK